jgi:multiple sugar transport system substrate-binding protein
LAFALLSVLAVRAQDQVTITYQLWDTSQVPQYQQCADVFTQENPGITISISQLGWNDYWNGITTGFVSGEMTDVFTDHLAKYPEYVTLGQLVDLQPYVDRDNVPLDIYLPGLAELWEKDGGRYGLPKDWDTIGIFYNKDLLDAAGVDPSVMDTWTWNPEDGGTFQETIAMLTIDANGNNGLSPDFDKDNVVQYGITGTGMGGPYGQTEWSWLTNTTGWVHTNGLWGDHYNFDDARFIASIQWYADLWLVHGFAPDLAQVNSLGPIALFQAGNVALEAQGSWQISTLFASEFPVGVGRLPIGPEGRKSMFNGLADSIWVGTQHPEEAWQWVKFMASPECENIVGDAGVVFPATPDGVEHSLAAREAVGIDVSAFTDQAAEENGTFLYPITDFGGEINTIMTEAMDSIGLGQGTAADILPAANEEVNALFQ